MRKKILICHPDVLREVRFATRLYHNPADLDVDLNRMEVRTNQYMDKYQKTGRYILPDLSLIHISEPTRPCGTSRMPSSA